MDSLEQKLDDIRSKRKEIYSIMLTPRVVQNQSILELLIAELDELREQEHKLLNKGNDDVESK